MATKAGVSPGRVQHYFPSRADLVEAAFDRANDLAGDRIAALTRGEAQSRPRQVLTTVLTEPVPHDRETRTHMRVRQFTAQALTDERVTTRLRDAYSQLITRLSRLISAVRLVALVEGLAYHVLIGTHPGEVARRQARDAIEALYR